MMGDEHEHVSLGKKVGGGTTKRLKTASTRKINTYFIKKAKVEVEADQAVALSTVNVSHTKNPPVFESTRKSISSLNFEFTSDIGAYISAKTNMHELPDETKALLLEKHWTPPTNFDFPYEIVERNGKTYKKYVQKSHFEKFHWLVLSQKDQGLYCKYCVLFIPPFSHNFVRSNPGRLVKEPLKHFNNLLGQRGLLVRHQNHQYHKMAVENGKNFLEYYHKPEIDIANQISTQRMAQVAENRDRLRPIIKTIILCGRQNIPLRGHRDDGQIFSIKNETSDVSHSEGNFRALLKFRVDAGDLALEQHLSSTSSTATYVSKTVQNELINICKEKIQESIIENVKKAKFYAIIFDETTDISRTEQMSLSLRYFNDGVIKENFVCFCDAYDMLQREEGDSSDDTKELRLTGIALAKIVEKLCQKFDLDLSFCVGIGTDSCSVMASDVKGAVQEIIKKAIHAKRCPCSNHALNNSLAKCSNITSCRNTTGTMKKIVAFANASAKRHRVFSEELGGSSIQSLCETRWAERHDGHLQFQGDNLLKMCNALERISTWQDNKTSSDAHCLLQTLRSSDFIISSICLSDVLGTTVSLSRFLQTASLDMKRTRDAIMDVLEVLKSKRQNADSVFNQLYAEATEQAKQLDVTLKAPRVIATQRNRANYVSNSTEDYFRKSIYIPLLDSVINDLEHRFSPEVLDLFQLGVFLPKSVNDGNQNIHTVKKLVQMYKNLLLDCEAVVLNEYRLWMAKWNREYCTNSAIPESVPHLIEACDQDLFPNIKIFLKILATLPVSVATAERSFSTLRRVKSWLRASMGQERLTGLALLNIYKDVNLDIDEIINKFAKKKRKLDFIL